MSKKVTVRTVAKRVRLIERSTSDDEFAHSEEDALYWEVLLAIAEERVDDPAAVAREALRTKAISFARWCA